MPRPQSFSWLKQNSFRRKDIEKGADSFSFSFLVPAAMGRKCKGTVEGEKCVFGPGGNASPKPGNDRCSWCCPQLLQQVVGTAVGRSKLRQHYSKFTEAVALKVLGRLPEQAKTYFDADGIDKLRKASPSLQRTGLPRHSGGHCGRCPGLRGRSTCSRCPATGGIRRRRPQAIVCCEQHALCGSQTPSQKEVRTATICLPWYTCYMPR